MSGHNMGAIEIKKYHAIPTTYGGVNFRSRLEAKYAALFDQLEWQWEYEPIDLKGWIPDFVIRGVTPILVEIKPIFEFDEELGRRIADAVGHKGPPGDIACGEFETLICGAVLPENCFGEFGPGWLWDGWWSPAHVAEVNGKEARYGLCHDNASYLDRINSDIGRADWQTPADLRAMWLRAGNLVQWRPR